MAETTFNMTKILILMLLFAFSTAKPKTNMCVTDNVKDVKDVKDEMSQPVDPCFKQFNMTQSRIFAIVSENRELPNNCFFKCKHEQMNFLKNGKYDMEALMAFMLKDNTLFAGKSKELREAIDNCHKESYSTDVCIYAKNMADCIFFGRSQGKTIRKMSNV